MWALHGARLETFRWVTVPVRITAAVAFAATPAVLSPIILPKKYGTVRLMPTET